MGDSVMQIDPEQMESIGHYVRLHIHEWLGEGEVSRSSRDRELDQRDRIIRVEESLKNQQDLMRQGFENMEKRFEQIDKRFEQVDKRFEQVDKRFEELRQDTNRRFEQVDKQFNRVFTFQSAIFLTLLTGFVTVMIRLIQPG